MIVATLLNTGSIDHMQQVFQISEQSKQYSKRFQVTVIMIILFK